ncbi:GntR family transcriptional regulator [Sulfobacillus harzensis]|uniref:GntR family transcriptional regulator n=1 Tax=Sulfobacillus harzensis TaxID=2729629 RepID=A0A7Y0L2D7_9FIRM|nr:GntR family transcriptional regulator [Sulfobacillus harzensis]NMP21120.1 GntR family transcriptional regulator [Sulfobacillus harzensis]
MYSPLANRLDLLVQRYREAIVKKRLTPGTVLSAESEAKVLNVPASLVRNAFRHLANMGLVELSAGGQATVKANNILSLQSLEFTLTRRRA